MSTEVLGDMLVRYRADITDLTSKVKSMKSDMSSMAEVTDKSTKQMTSSFKNTSYEAKKTGGEFLDSIKHGLEMAGAFKALELASEGVHKLGEQFVDVIKVAIDHQQIMAQTNQVLKSTKDVSGMTAVALDDLAIAFSKTTQYSADTVQGGENLLLTFTNIGKSVFPQATQAILDVSQAMGQDLKSSAIQVGKALGDPLTGMTALQRIGVTFSTTEKEQIKTMMAHNNIIGAQTVILKELSTEFGGSAAAAGKTFGGQMAILNNELEDMKIKIGTALLPILTQFLSYISAQIMPRLNDFSIWFQKDGIPLIQQFGDWFQKEGIPRLMDFGGAVLNIVMQGAHFVQWLHDGTPPAKAFTIAALALGGAIALIKVSLLVNDMKNFITATPQIIAKMLLIQESAEAAAGANGVGGIGGLTGALSKLFNLVGPTIGLGLLAGQLSVAIPILTGQANDPAAGPNPTLKDYHGPHSGFGNPQKYIDADNIKKAAQDAKDLADQIALAWKDMEGLSDYAHSHQRILGDITDPIALTKDDLKLQQIKAHLDDIAKPYEPKIITADIEKARMKVIELKTRIDDLKGPVSIGVISPQVEAARLKVILLKSTIDDTSGGPSGIPHLASGGFIQSSGLAFVHAGETVVPASGAGAQTSSSGGSRGDTHIHIEVGGTEVMHYILNQADSHIKAKYGPYARVA